MLAKGIVMVKQDVNGMMNEVFRMMESGMAVISPDELANAIRLSVLPFKRNVV